MFKICLFFVLGVVVSASAFSCKDVGVQTGFDMYKFLGRWHACKYAVPVELPIPLRCLKFDFIDEFPGQNDTFLFDMNMAPFGSPVHVFFDVKIPDVNNEAARWVISNTQLPDNANLFILHSDYNTGMYVTCFDDEETGEAGFGEIAMFSRNTTLSDDVFNAYKFMLSNYGVETSYLNIVHNDCPQDQDQ